MDMEEVKFVATLVGAIIFVILVGLIGMHHLDYYIESEACNAYDNLGWNTKVVQVGPMFSCMLEYNDKWVYRENVNIVIGEINYENERN